MLLVELLETTRLKTYSRMKLQYIYLSNFSFYKSKFSPFDQFDISKLIEIVLKCRLTNKWNSITNLLVKDLLVKIEDKKEFLLIVKYEDSN